MSKSTHQLNKNTFKYLLIGSSGFLGSELKKILPKKETFCVARKNSDFNINLQNINKLSKIFNSYNFKFAINCAAKTSIEYCENKKIFCKKINTSLPIELDKLSKKYKFRLVHISTDQVYNSKSKKKNREFDQLGSSNYYSKTKLLAEKILMKNQNNLIIRTNFTGITPSKKTFVSWLLESVLNKKKINLLSDMFVSTLDVKSCAKLINELIKKNATGIFNLGTSDFLSKEQFAIYFAKKLNKNIYFNSISVKDMPVARPKYLALDVSKIEKFLGKKMINSFTSIKRIIREINKK